MDLATTGADAPGYRRHGAGPSAFVVCRLTRQRRWSDSADRPPIAIHLLGPTVRCLSVVLRGLVGPAGSL